MELIPSMINKSEFDILNAAFGDFYSIPLSNNNFRSELIKDNDNFKLSNYFKDINPIKFISITDMAKMNEFNYADIVIFSNNKILKDIECCL